MNTPSSSSPGRAPRVPLRPLCRLLAFSVATATCSAVGMFPGLVHAQANTPPIAQTSTGMTPADGSGATGGQAADVSVSTTVGSVVGDDSSNPSVLASSTGGAGGTGSDGGDPTGSGGKGGNAGQVTFSLDSGSSVYSGSTAPAAVTLVSKGGAGGTAGAMSSEQGHPGTPGSAGDSGGIQVYQGGSITSTQGWNGDTPGTTAVSLLAAGGDAAEPLSQDQATGDSPTGPSGGSAGMGGPISYQLLSGSVFSAGSGVVAVSKGGQGGDGYGAYADAGKGTGGNGGAGGSGNAVQLTAGTASGPSLTITATGAPGAATGASIPIDANGVPARAAVMAAGIQAQSLGGEGGQGGTGDGTAGGQAGRGGNAGAGGTVAVSLTGTNIQTTGFAAAGVLAQSIGGAGGNGNAAGGIFFGVGGNGGLGGDSNAVTLNLAEKTGVVWPTSLISTAGDDSMGVVAQSIGGGGGAGGSVAIGSILSGLSLGGTGTTGGEGGVVSVNNGLQANGSTPAQPGFIISTLGERSSGVVAQSIGGGGGSGGSASSTVLGPFAFAVGGSGGGGGNAGTPGVLQASVLNEGIVSTAGNHAKGVVAQAVGGGGGDGGSATAVTLSAQVNVNVSVGGSGGVGGNSGDVTATNGGEILTNGSDAWGMLSQAVSGGGGNGGMSKSDAYQLASSKELPSVIINASIGGAGGGSGNSGNVSAINDGVIMTAGAGAHGILAQSISGGGGNGGDSTAQSYTGSAGSGATIDMTLALGGSGGQSGTAGNVTVDNTLSSLIWTLGDSANGIFAQSVGGGGGSGGFGKGDTRFIGPGGGATGGQSTVSLGGMGANGSAGGTVTVTNEGNILTLGDSANGIFAQSVGGGGGLSTGGTAKGSSGKLSETLTLGGGTLSGTAATAGTGGTVNVTNKATIVTYGGAAAGIFAQSVGGGGGAAGSGSTAGLATMDSTGSLSDYLSSSKVLKSSISNYNGVSAWHPGGWYLNDVSTMESWANDYLSYAANHSAGTLPDGTGGILALAALMGGGASGGDAGGATTDGDGGTVNVTNNFMIKTFGPASPGISAQSVGAGGGSSGATAVSQFQASNGNNSAQATMKLGGNAPNWGNGSWVNVSNTGSIGTQGDASFGIFAQSVGAGGGQSVLTVGNLASAGNGKALSIALAGGDNNTTGDGGPVQVTNAGGQISTSGAESVAIVAQSVGGGGGSAVVLTTAAQGAYSRGAANYAVMDPTGQDNVVSVGSNGTTTQTNPLPACAAGGGYSLNACGNGNTADVDILAGGTVSTQGTNAHGILAQSVGGGGGWIAGITSAKGSQPFPVKASMGGSGGDVHVGVVGSVSTQGNGAYGVLAQSVGGGGVLGGDLAVGGARGQFTQPSNGNNGFQQGSGGDVDVEVSGTVSTTGSNAHAVFAQSVGGGGGLWATTDGQSGTMLMGSAGATGNAGTIAITNTGTIQATGSGSSAIFTNAAGQNNAATVTINNSGTITGNATTPAIMLTGGNTSATNGDGFVVNNASGVINALNGTAIAAPDSFAEVQNGGTINGNIQIGSGGFANQSYWGTGSVSTAQVVNYGVLNINGANGNALGNSVISGSLTNYGQLQSSVDFYNKQAGVLAADTVALQSGTTVMVRPQLLVPNSPTTILEATHLSNAGPIHVSDPGNNFLYSYGITFPTSNPMLMQVQAFKSSFYAQAISNTTNQNLLNLAALLDTDFNVPTQLTVSQAQTYASFSTIGNTPNYMNALTNLSNESGAAASVTSLAASNAFVERMNSCPRFEDGGLFQREHDCVWGRTIANDIDHGVSSNSVGYHQSSQAVQLGGQKEVAPDWFVGGSVSADNSSLDTHTVNDTVSGKGWTAGLVAKHQMGDWLVSGAFTAGQMSYDATRQVQIPGIAGTATSSFDVSHVGIHSRISRQFAYDTWYLKPYVDLHATHVESGSYTEQGAGPLNLRAAASNTNVLGASPMLEAGTRFNLSDGMTLQAYAGMGATFYNQGALGADMQFADSVPGTGSFHVSSEIPQSRFKATAGLDLAVSDQVDVRVEYTGEFADHFHSNTAALKATYKF